MSNTDESDAKRARVNVAAKPRRIIFNDHEPALANPNTPETFLPHRMRPLAETQYRISPAGQTKKEKTKR